jgi:hypothetical protein
MMEHILTVLQKIASHAQFSTAINVLVMEHVTKIAAQIIANHVFYLLNTALNALNLTYGKEDNAKN